MVNGRVEIKSSDFLNPTLYPVRAKRDFARQRPPGVGFVGVYPG